MHFRKPGEFLLLQLMTTDHKAGHYSFTVILGYCTVLIVIQAGGKSFGIYSEGDDTINLKVPWVRDRTASGGAVCSSPWLCGGRCCFCSPCGSWSIGIGGCDGFFFHLQAGVWGQSSSHTLDQWWSCTAWWSAWSSVCAVGFESLTISVVRYNLYCTNYTQIPTSCFNFCWNN